MVSWSKADPEENEESKESELRKRYQDAESKECERMKGCRVAMKG